MAHRLGCLKRIRYRRERFGGRGELVKRSALITLSRVLLYICIKQLTSIDGG